MKSGQRNVRVSVFGAQLDGFFQRLLDLGAQALRQCFGDADALTIATQCIGLPVPGIRVFRVGRLLRLCAAGDFHKQLEFGLLLFFKVVGVQAGSLVRYRDPVAAGLQTSVCRLLKLAVVKQHPGLQHGSLFGQQLAVADMQACPTFLQACGIELVVAGVGKSSPFGHFCLLD